MLARFSQQIVDKAMTRKPAQCSVWTQCRIVKLISLSTVIYGNDKSPLEFRSNRFKPIVDRKIDLDDQIAGNVEDELLAEEARQEIAAATR